MTDAQYTFDTTPNSYFQGSDLRVTDGTGHTILVNEKDGLLAVNVKDDGTVNQFPADVHAAWERLPEQSRQSLYDGVVREFWDWVSDLAGTYDLPGVAQEGREGGWLCVTGIADIGAGDLIEPDEEARDVRDRFLAFAFEAERSIEDEWRPMYYKALKAEAERQAALKGLDALTLKVWHAYPRFNHDETGTLLDALNVRALETGEPYGDTGAESAGKIFRELTGEEPDEKYSIGRGE